MANLDVYGYGYVRESITRFGAFRVERGEGEQSDRGAQSAQLGAGVVAARCARAACPVFAQRQVLCDVKVCCDLFGGCHI